jgi:hypothetical protein
MNVENHAGQFISVNSRLYDCGGGFTLLINFAATDICLNFEISHVYRMASTWKVHVLQTRVYLPILVS